MNIFKLFKKRKQSLPIPKREDIYRLNGTSSTVVKILEVCKDLDSRDYRIWYQYKDTKSKKIGVLLLEEFNKCFSYHEPFQSE